MDTLVEITTIETTVDAILDTTVNEVEVLVASTPTQIDAVVVRNEYNPVINIENPAPVINAVFQEVVQNIVVNIAQAGQSSPSYNAVISYRSSFEADLWIYSGFLLNGTIIIKRTKDNLEELGQGLTDLETDWTNRLSLTYI